MLYLLSEQIREIINHAYSKKYYFSLSLSDELKTNTFAKYVPSNKNVILLNSKCRFSHTAKCLSLLREVAKCILHSEFQAQAGKSITYGGPEFWIIYKKLITAAVALNKMTALDILAESKDVESITKVHTIARNLSKPFKKARVIDKTYRFYCFSKDIKHKEILKQEGFIWNPFIQGWFTKDLHKEKIIPDLKIYKYEKEKFILLA